MRMNEKKYQSSVYWTVLRKQIQHLKKKLAHDMWKIVKNDQPIHEKKLTN